MKNDIIAFISKNYKLLLWGVIAAILIVLFTLIWIMIWVIQASPDEINFINIADQTAKLKLIKLIGWGVSGLIAILGVLGLFQRSTSDKQLERDKSINPLFTFIKNREFLLFGVIASIIILHIGFIAIIWAIGLPSKSPIFMDIAGSTRIELIKLIGLGMGGLIAILGVLGIFQRGSALDKQNEMTEKGHIYERFKVATEHLGNNRDSVRIAAFYEFYHLAEMKPDWQRSIFNILCAHLRKTTKHKKYTPEKRFSPKKNANEIKPTEEVQTLLYVLFTRRNNYDKVFDDLIANLEGANLQGANLQEANLQKANLQEANLQGADLEEAFLQKAFLYYANLQGTDLQRANLQKANLRGARITQETIATMPPNWEKVVKKDENDETGVIFVED